MRFCRRFSALGARSGLPPAQAAHRFERSNPYRGKAWRCPAFPTRAGYDLQLYHLHRRTRGTRPGPRVERIRITPEGLEREAAKDLVALRFIVSSPEISRELWIYTPKGTFRFFRVLANSVAELDRSGQLMPDQPPVPKRRKTPAAPGPDGKSGEPESAPGSSGSAVIVPLFLLPAVTPESVDPLTVSVGENTHPESKGWERE